MFRAGGLARFEVKYSPNDMDVVSRGHEAEAAAHSADECATNTASPTARAIANAARATAHAAIYKDVSNPAAACVFAANAASAVSVDLGVATYEALSVETRFLEARQGMSESGCHEAILGFVLGA